MEEYSPPKNNLFKKAVVLSIDFMRTGVNMLCKRLFCDCMTLPNLDFTTYSGSIIYNHYREKKNNNSNHETNKKTFPSQALLKALIMFVVFFFPFCHQVSFLFSMSQ